MAYRRRRHDKGHGNQTFALNITSMTDMFTILLVFLLQTYNTNEFQVDPEKGISLPLSSSYSEPTKSIKVSMSKTELMIEGRKIASITPQGDFERADLENSDSNFVKPLFTELEKVAKEKPDEKFVKDGNVVLVADSSLNYNILRKVMYTASMAGFPKLKLATVLGE